MQAMLNQIESELIPFRQYDKNTIFMKFYATQLVNFVWCQGRSRKTV